MDTRDQSRRLPALWWNPMLPWVDLSLRAIDISMGAVQSWQQWLAGMGTLVAGGPVRDEVPRSVPQRDRVQREHAAALADAAARRKQRPAPKRPASRARASGKNHPRA